MSDKRQSLGLRALQGGAALAGARIMVRGIDLVRMITIARWLGTEEMGIYAVASLTVSALDQFTDTGLRLALIQRQGDIGPMIVPARTVQALRGLLLSVVVFVFAPMIAEFFSSPKSLGILRVIAIVPAIRGFETFFVTLAQKELRFGTMIILQGISAVVGLCVGLVAARIRPDAWAMVWSTLAAAVVMTVGSHFLSPRSELGLSLQWRPLSGLHRFSFWIFVTTIVSYLIAKGGDWVVGRFLDVHELALYQMAFLICTLATAEVGAVISQLSLPVFSSLQHDMARLQAAFQQAFGIIAIAVCLLVALLSTCASDIFAIMLGPQWAEGVRLVPYLAIWGGCSTLSFGLSGVFLALGHSKTWMRLTIIMACMMGAGLVPVTLVFGASGAAGLLATVGVIMQLVRYRALAGLLRTPLAAVMCHVVIPAIAAVVTSAGLLLSRHWWPFETPELSLVISAIATMVCYFGLLLLLGRWMNPNLGSVLAMAAGFWRRDRERTV